MPQSQESGTSWVLQANQDRIDSADAAEKVAKSSSSLLQCHRCERVQNIQCVSCLNFTCLKIENGMKGLDDACGKMGRKSMEGWEEHE